MLQTVPPTMAVWFQASVCLGLQGPFQGLQAVALGLGLGISDSGLFWDLGLWVLVFSFVVWLVA